MRVKPWRLLRVCFTHYLRSVQAVDEHQRGSALLLGGEWLQGMAYEMAYAAGAWGHVGVCVPTVGEEQDK